MTLKSTCPRRGRPEAAPRPRSSWNSFTLIEVVIAIAIISFVLISILGLMTYASELVQKSDNYSRLSNVSSQVLAQFDSQSYSITTEAVTNPALLPSTAVKPPYYFTYDGVPTNSTYGYYECDLSNVTPAPASTTALTNVMCIQLSIRWPKSQPTSTNVIITSTLNYD